LTIIGPSRNRELSEYVSLTYDVTPKAEITAGARYIDFLNTGDAALATGAGGGSNQSGALRSSGYTRLFLVRAGGAF